MKRKKEVLKSLWDKSYLRGTCWSRKGAGNIIGGSNLVLAVGDELVSVAEEGMGGILEFRKAENTVLGKEVKELLQSIQKQLPALTYGDIMKITDKDILWGCWKCRKTHGVDGANDPNTNVRNIKEDHKRVSPDCHPPISQFKIYTIYDGKLKEEIELLNILALEPVKS